MKSTPQLNILVGLLLAGLLGGALAGTTAVVRNNHSVNPDIANYLDRERLTDLESIQSELTVYFATNGNYPDTKNQTQNVCKYPEDMLCVFQFPQAFSTADYWYISDGTYYTLYAQRDGAEQPDCPEPEHIRAQGSQSVLCVHP